jgi:hypothetical protein
VYKEVCPTDATSAPIVSRSRERKLKILSYPILTDFRKTVAFWKVSRLRLFVLLVRATCTRRRSGVRRTGGIIQVKAGVLGGKTCPIATLWTNNPTWTGLGCSQVLFTERVQTKRLSHDTAFKYET